MNFYVIFIRDTIKYFRRVKIELVEKWNINKAKSKALRKRIIFAVW